MQFTFVVQPTIADIEHAIAAKRRATKVFWLDLAGGLLITAMACLGILILLFDPLSRSPLAMASTLLLLVWGILILTGHYGRAYRRLFVYRNDPDLFLDMTITLDDEGIRSVDTHHDERTTWAAWKAWIRTKDGIALLTSVKGAAGYEILPRRALTEPSRWNEMLAFVSAHVPRHPGQRAAN